MAYYYQVGKYIFFPGCPPPPPTRKPVFISARPDLSLDNIGYYCNDIRKIFFALLWPAEHYLLLPEKDYVPIASINRNFPNRYPDGLYAGLLAMQILPKIIMDHQEQARLNLPECVIYTADMTMPGDEESVTSFIEVLCDSYRISRFRSG